MQAWLGVLVLVIGVGAAVGAHLHAVARIGTDPDRRRHRSVVGLPWFLAFVTIFNGSAVGTRFGARLDILQMRGPDLAGVSNPEIGRLWIEFAKFLFWVLVAIVWPFLYSGRAVAKLRSPTDADLDRIVRRTYLWATGAYLISGAASFPLGDVEQVQEVVDLLFGSWAPPQVALLLGLELVGVLVLLGLVVLVHFVRERVKTGSWRMPTKDDSPGGGEP